MMAQQIPAWEVKLAQQAAAQTGLDPTVILAQWIAENGWQWPASNNPGNITYYGGPGQVGYFVAKNGQRFAKYATPQAGVSAYIQLMNSQYPQVEQSGAQAEIKALQQSAWDAGHYPQLPAVYQSVRAALGASDSQPEQPEQQRQSQPQQDQPKISLLQWVLVIVGGLFIAGGLFA